MATVRELPKIINGVDIESLGATIRAIEDKPAIASFKFRVQNQWQGAGKNCSTVGDFFGTGQEISRAQPFTLHADEPQVLLGQDVAANPVEHLLHALAACLTTSMVYHAAARGIHLQEVESRLEGDLDLQGFLDLDPKVRKGYRGIRVNFRIKADVPGDQLQEIVELGTGHSPVFDSLTKGVPVTVSVER